MTLSERMVVGFFLAAAVVLVATPYTIRVAERLEFFDHPIGYKGHAGPTPYLGGTALMSGFVLALLAAAGNWDRTAPLVVGVVVLWGVGTVDDRRAVSPLVRVLVEAVLALMVWQVGLGWHLGAGGAVDAVTTCLWIVGVVNAFNLFDNMDGAAGTMAVVVSAGAAVLGFLDGSVWLAAGATCLSGACVGFLPRNLSRPARIFLGDGGSMPLGFVVAVLVTAAAAMATSGAGDLLVGVLLVGIPALDTCLVVISRRRRGVGLLTGGRDHLTHRTRSFLPNARAVALSLAAAQAGVSTMAILASQGGVATLEICVLLYAFGAAAAIVLVETVAVEESPSPAAPSARAKVAVPQSWWTLAILAVVGLAAGLSPFDHGYYDPGVWVPLGLAVSLAAAACVVARPRRIHRDAALTVGGLLGLGVWSLISTIWSESAQNATVAGDLALAYGAFLIVLIVLVRETRRCASLLAACGVGVTAVAVSVLVRMLGDDPGSLFLGGRLNAPLGYINGEGCLFVMGFWLAVALAEHRSRPRLAGLGAGIAALLACLALLSQSRGTALALASSAAVLFAAVPGRRARLFLLLLVGAGVAAAAPELFRVYSRATAGNLSPSVAHAAGRAALLASLGVGIAWGLAAKLTMRFAERGAAASRRLDRVANGLIAVMIAAALIVSGVKAQSIQHVLRTQWHAFVHLSEPGSSAVASGATAQTRLISGSGNRFDYWRIAWRTWKRHPVLGVGAGNYPVPYYAQRATSEDIQQPHSLELQALSELGLVGIALLALTFVGIGLAVSRMRRLAARSSIGRSLTVGSLGVLVAWLSQTSADWMHLLPGVTAIAIAAAAVLLHSHRDVSASEPSFGLGRPTRPALLGLVGIAVALILAGASLSRQGLSDLFRKRAQSALSTNPALALREAQQSLAINRDDMGTYYVKAAALARFGNADGALATLTAALRQEPDNFVTWALLGDVNVRRGRLRAAQRAYARAHALNPRDPTLIRLVKDPRSALA